MQQHITSPTHRSGHMLDLVISRTASAVISNTSVYPSSISDHFSVLFHLTTPKIPSTRQLEHVRNFRDLDQCCFEEDLSAKLASIDTQLDHLLCWKSTKQLLHQQ
jgi:hypothetical protein